MNALWAQAAAGFVAWLIATLVFRYLGQTFFWWDANYMTVFFLIAGVVLFFAMRFWLGATGVAAERRPAAAIAFVLPGMLLDAAIVSHFAIVFPNLDPDMDKVFGALMLWGYGFLLFGALWSKR